ncbi:hypothetical protein VFPPC_04171 [Pochonia chlamydosporia 170]|uniref:Uncharacterized protein n=1 Tax=Pochonia chlamydosporia 170 TaxID=1380566 RepID=A0A179FRS5_METCM|nr:hypothetical protein VFPPC_04171 [Pochonia chlamydosporia 170]OAQ67831.1 hypothetical protein VFPPC_04171 [Pochonia chlamydosporia 170]
MSRGITKTDLRYPRLQRLRTPNRLRHLTRDAHEDTPCLYHEFIFIPQTHSPHSLQTRVVGKVLNNNNGVHSDLPLNLTPVAVANDEETKFCGNCAFEPTVSFDPSQFPEKLEPSSMIINSPRMPQSRDGSTKQQFRCPKCYRRRNFRTKQSRIGRTV